jgi:putative PEP-CTERM system histidine kinase
MIEILGQWSYALAAALYAAMAVWQSSRDTKSATGRAMTYALSLTALSALAAALSGGDSLVAKVTIHGRDLGWLVFMHAIWRQGDGRDRTSTVRWLYGVTAIVISLNACLEFLPTLSIAVQRLGDAAFLTGMLLRMTSMVGALVLVHNLYTAATTDARNTLRMPLVALGVLWIYDLNLFTSAYLGREWPMDLVALRGAVMTLVAPVFGLAALRNRDWSMRLSRSMTFQSMSLVAIGGYLAAMVIVTSALELIGGQAARAAQASFVFAASLAALVLMPSPRFRAWFKVKIAKHFFQHRYDYRLEWLRFTQTLGHPEGDAQPLATRVIKAIADIAESPGGMLLTPEGSGPLIAQARWNWSGRDPGGAAGSAALAAYMSKTGRIIELDALRRESGAEGEDRVVPEWILAEHKAWALVPLVHVDRLAGVVLLLRPSLNRTLDWEDFDLLRVAGRQVASYLAEARGQEALSDVKRFDEFNRRFAFIMHDIKNLVSQLSLVTRNAERHAGNPEFQADMIETLKSSTARMNALLARLSQHNKGRPEESGPMLIVHSAERVAAARRGQHPVVITGDQGVVAMADTVRLDQALGHLVQNAIDASPTNEPVTIHLSQTADEALIEVIDLGIGMSPAFVSEQLFKPFASTKETGFGIGSYEARSILIEMGGRIEVMSREGEGSRFTISLPLATAEPNMETTTIEAQAA